MENEKSNAELLEEELKRQLEELKTFPVGSEGSKAILDDMLDLSKVASEWKKLEIEADKAKAELELAVRKHEDERALEAQKAEREQAKFEAEWKAKENEHREASKQRWTAAILQGVGFGVSIGLAAMSRRETRELLGTVLKFEESGNYVSSAAGKSLLGSIFRIRK